MTEGLGEAQRGVGVGVLLREHRLRARLSLPDLATAVHVRPSFLQAIEDSRYEDLPEPVYAAGFVKAYAEQVGLDADAVARRFRSEMSGRAGTVRLNFPAPPAEAETPTGGVLLLGAAMALLAYATWYIMSSRDAQIAEAVPPLPPQLEQLATEAVPYPEALSRGRPRTAAGGISGIGPPAATLLPPGAAAPAVPWAPAGAPAGAPEGAPARAPAAAAAVAPADGTGVVPKAGSPPQPLAARIDPWQNGAGQNGAGQNGGGQNGGGQNDIGRTHAEAGPQPAAASGREDGLLAVQPTPAPVSEALPVHRIVPPPPPGAQPGRDAMAAEPPPALTAGPGRIVLRARTDSWVEVREPESNTPLTARLLKAGETYPVPDRPGLKLVTGNAGGLLVEVDGRPAPPLGRDGVVRRGIPLDPELLRRGSETATP